jgi:quinoprotein glucose dehydrogenase
MKSISEKIRRSYTPIYRIYVKTVLPALLYCLVTMSGTPAHAWQYSGGDTAGTRYSPLEQINRDNVDKLALAWSARSGEHKALPAEHYRRSAMQSTPILLPRAAGEHLLVCSGNNYLLALDPETGKERWRYDPEVPLEKRVLSYKCRGNAFYWEDRTTAPGETCRHRLFLGALDRRLIALDARTGKPCSDFADGGILDLDHPQEEGFDKPMVFTTSQPVVVDGKVIVGSSILDLAYRHTPVGTINAYDARSGVERWRFNIVPIDPTDPATATWPEQPDKQSGAANAWAPLSVDEANKLVFIPTSSPSPDFYGGYRHGDNLYSDSLVALDAQSGEVVWHYQFVHHDLWDYDAPAQPILFDYQRGTERIPAVLQLTKQGMLFVFNRLTGEPLIPIEERPVPATEVPGEKVSATQPFSQLPPLVRHTVTENDIWGLTPIDRWFCEQSFKEIRNEGIFTPPGFGRPSMHMPSDAGGSNWGGAGLTPDNLLLANVMDVAQTLQLIPIAELGNEVKEKKDAHDYMKMGHVKIRDTDYAFVKKPWVSPLGIPCVAPPWNKLVAIDLNTGATQWQVPLGSLHDSGPFTLPFDINGFGVPGIGSGVATAGGLFVIAGTSDNTIRAFDTSNGEMLWSYRMPVDGHSGVSTYEFKGRQYFVTTAGGHEHLGRETGDYILAFTLRQ